MRILAFFSIFFILFINNNLSVFAQGKVRAVIIGVSKYPNLPLDKQLDYADSDALAFYNYLRKIPNADTLNIVEETTTNN